MRLINTKLNRTIHEILFVIVFVFVLGPILSLFYYQVNLAFSAEKKPDSTVINLSSESSSPVITVNNTTLIVSLGSLARNILPKDMTQTASIWSSFIDWLYPDTPETTYPTYVTIEEFNQLKQTVNNLSISSVGQTGLTGPQGPRGLTGPSGPQGPSGSGETIIKETIIREIVQGPSGQSVDLSSLDSRISFASATASSANLSIKSYNDSFTTKELTVTEGTTLASLTATSLTVSGGSTFNTFTAVSGSVTSNFSIGGTLTL